MSEDDVMSLARVVGSPPLFFTPPTRPGETRHYVPKTTKRSGSSGETALLYSGHLSVDPSDPLVICWPTADLSAEQRDALSALCASLGYLGRAESVVDVQAVQPGESEWRDIDDHDRWWMPSDLGLERILCTTDEVVRAELEVRPDQMRSAKRLVPQGARWCSYRGPTAQVRPRPHPSSSQAAAPVAALRWRLLTSPPMRARVGVAATDFLRRRALELLPSGEKGLSDDQILLRGKDRDNNPVQGHRHVHWWWTTTDASTGSSSGVPDPQQATLQDIVLWAPQGLTDEHELLSRLASLTEHLPRNRGRMPDPPRGFVEGRLQLVGAGALEQVDASAIAPHRVWRSITPYLLGRHYKQRRDSSIESFVQGELARECTLRGLPAPTVEVQGGHDAGAWLRRYQRHRPGQSMSLGPPAFDLTLTFETTQTGPLLLGALSHFGFGRFTGAAPLAP